MISASNLTFSYHKTAVPAIQNLSFEVQQGEIYGFLGPSGAGKSTTQKILIGLLSGFSGNVSVFGKPLKNWKSEYYERIGVSFEFPNHFLKLTALENLAYFSKLYKGKTIPPEKLLGMVGLGGDGTVPVGQYSKGMKNRLSVARSILHTPELLFLDEPTAGLDPVNARNIKDLIRTQRDGGATVFLTTHDMTVADELCDRVAFLVGGSIAVIDRPRELKIRYGQSKVRVESDGAGGMHHHEFSLQRLGENAEFLNLLRGEKIQTIHSLEATLEDVFIKVTGRGLQ
ncbi:MAG: ABC transporter ATP-binding protein [Bacteroidota bacterium]